MKNIGLCVLGVSILFGFASLEMRLESIEAKLTKANAMSLSLSHIADAIPANALEEQ